MPKIAFLGAGSAAFAKNVLGDAMLCDALHDAHIALYDIDAYRLDDAQTVLDRLNATINDGRATISVHCGPDQRADALRDADYVVNAVQVGGYDPGTLRDFEIPKKYGLRQTIGDTLGIGGIFRALRTIPVVLDFARDMERLCPSAWLLNYTNPMAMITGAVLRASDVRAVGLCHSVQGCAKALLGAVGMTDEVDKLQWKVAGINHQGWLLEITDGGKDLYPEIKRRAAERIEQVRRRGVRAVLDTIDQQMKHDGSTIPEASVAGDLVRLEVMRYFGYYLTESSEHTAEYVPWFIKSSHPELIEQFNIPLDEYLARCRRLMERWPKQREELLSDELTHTQTNEYAAEIMAAMETDRPYRFAGNVLNTGLIENLPTDACVEVACLADRNGVTPCHHGALPPQCAAMNRTSINVQLLTIHAALTRKREHVYQAAMLDPHTAAELTLDEIRRLCDELLEAHRDLLPDYA
ncbi:MAG: alpha-glucosidase/alpha-galactosidase [Phycisphaerae bacterium]|nr:alpha-glucosidase/alpha-galactosidase [Phycisphaerae bacterium]